MKRFTSSSQQKMSMQYYRSVPAQINKRFTARQVDAAFISSISAKKYKHVGLGIIAKEEVRSVIVIPNANNESDCESASSNVLANILNIKGKVLIGDKALKYTLSSSEYIDLAELWHKKYNLPFVFALLCFHKDARLYASIEKQFLKQKIKIPQYILEKASRRTQVEKKEIQNYLNYISYRLDSKAKLGLKKFYSLT